MRLEKAVVTGGSIPGMLAARVLADRFESVTIVETDKQSRRFSAIASTSYLLKKQYTKVH